jgi:anti-sigma B factor antagonist
VSDVVSVRASQAGDEATVVISGEVDLSTADTVLSELEQAVAGCATAVCDLSEVTYIDSRGIRLLVQVARGVRERGGSFTVVAPKETVAGGVLRLTHVQELDLD